MGEAFLWGLRKDIDAAPQEAAGPTIVLGALLDGVPESTSAGRRGVPRAAAPVVDDEGTGELVVEALAPPVDGDPCEADQRDPFHMVVCADRGERGHDELESDGADQQGDHGVDREGHTP